METIIATTDLSPNARAGLRFAIRLARKRNASLIILHVHYVLRASFWSDNEYGRYVAQSAGIIARDLSSFVKSVYRTMKLQPEAYELAVHHHIDTVEGILEYAERRKAAYICTSTRGAGRIRRLFGTVTGKLVAGSAIPVLCIPSTYRLAPVDEVLYASDLKGYEDELQRVVAFAKPIGAAVVMLHLAHSYEFLPDEELAVQSIERKAGYKVELRCVPRNTSASVLEDLTAQVKTMKPSLLALFTNQNRDFLERILLSSTTQAYACYAKVPLLSFRKRQAARA
jgi:nucleotide-binding universal stress UspA family protein